MRFIDLATVPSTNTWVRNHLASLTPPVCVRAQEQTAGRGRGAHTWLSPKGGGLYATFYQVRIAPYPQAIHLAKILSLAAARLFLEEGLFPQLKWPNDLFLNRKKCGGVLVETVPFENTLHLILGIGLNLNFTQDVLGTLQEKATSLHIETGKVWDRISLSETLALHFSTLLATLDQKGFDPFVSEYRALLIHQKGDPIEARLGMERLYGTYLDITEEGYLLLQLPSGKVRTLTGGEIEEVS